ncbi:uncharacterized protein B0T23DRAFT_320116 [Neurospora hispaniola]|uniref:EamA domain-containing protein n=1 Tax=Neurospora hispaniola TaxID=588809 RepID=A0AAJ0MPX3_9PEZI|nr:hypothetical protein B0T23DRAFT_320116 [Neurospora hispaniola]
MSRYDNLPDSKTDINPYDGTDSYAMISSSSLSSPDFIDKAPGPAKSHNNLTIPNLSTFQPSALRSLTTSPFSEHELLSPSFQHIRRTLSRSPSPSRSFQHGPEGPNPSNPKSRIINFVHRNRPLFQVAIAQLFGALMNLSARLLELSGEGEGGEEEGGKAGMHPFQILFARMFLTSLLSLLYMHWKKVEFAPWGRREVRWLLVLRGVTGFFGIFPLWYSMLYLPIAEATVITFLAPSLSGYLSHLLLKDPFTKKEQIASFVALAGVVLIARPISFLFSSPPSTSTTVSPSFDPNTNATNLTSPASPATNNITDDIPPSLRLLGIASALLSVLGASAAYTTIRALGPSTHPLISVNYFSLWCTFVSLLALLLCPLFDIGQEATDLVPAIRWGLPRGVYQWGLLIGLGVAGFVMQFLLTSGLGAGPGQDGDGGEKVGEGEGERRRDRRVTMTKGATKSNRATAMIYTQMLFAAGFDKWVFGRTMSGWSVVGCGLIVGSALWAVLGKETGAEKEGVRGGQEGADLEMVGGMRESRTESDEEEEEVEEYSRWDKSVTQVDNREDSVTVTFDDGTSTTGTLLVACDGANSVIRRALFPEKQYPKYQIPPFKSLVYNAPAGTEVKRLDLTDWAPPKGLRSRGRVALVGDALHPMAMYRGEGANHAILDVLEFAQEVLPYLEDTTAELRNAIDRYEGLVIARARPAVFASRQACIDAHWWERINGSSPLLSRRTPNVDFEEEDVRTWSH